MFLWPKALDAQFACEIFKGFDSKEMNDFIDKHVSKFIYKSILSSENFKELVSEQYKKYLDDKSSVNKKNLEDFEEMYHEFYSFVPSKKTENFSKNSGKIIQLKLIGEKKIVQKWIEQQHTPSSLIMPITKIHRKGRAEELSIVDDQEKIYSAFRKHLSRNITPRLEEEMKKLQDPKCSFDDRIVHFQNVRQLYAKILYEKASHLANVEKISDRPKYIIYKKELLEEALKLIRNFIYIKPN